MLLAGTSFFVLLLLNNAEFFRNGFSRLFNVLLGFCRYFSWFLSISYYFENNLLRGWRTNATDGTQENFDDTAKKKKIFF